MGGETNQFISSQSSRRLQIAVTELLGVLKLDLGCSGLTERSGDNKVRKRLIRPPQAKLLCSTSTFHFD